MYVCEDGGEDVAAGEVCMKVLVRIEGVGEDGGGDLGVDDDEGEDRCADVGEGVESWMRV